jgi:betaine-aldehyde dehydrogenase
MQPMYVKGESTTGRSGDAIEVRDPATEEVIMEYRSFDEAIALANDSPFALGACLLSSDPRTIKRFFEEVQAGTIWINDPLTDNYAGPFGGMRMSGGCRGLGQEGLEEFRATKHVHWDFSPDVKDFWYPY